MKTKMLRMAMWIAAVACLNIWAACSSNKTTTAAYYSYETECIGTELDGSMTLRAWGDGNTKKDAIEQAMKQAVHDVIFKGIIKGTSGSDARPLILEANAEDKYRNYFDKFFADGGEYLHYVNMKDEKSNSKQVIESANIYKYGVTVRVLRSLLRTKLQDDGIIK